MKTAIVTGASRGIGAAIARRLAEEGFHVVLSARNTAKLEATAEACRTAGGSAEILPADITDEAAVTELIRKPARLDLLVNNAGIGEFAPIIETTLEMWRRIQRVNVEGAFLCLREAMRRMKEEGGGRIINIASVVGVKGYPRQAAYGASKHALLGLTKTAIEEGREYDIRVHAVCPGGVDTDMLRQSRPDLAGSPELIRPEDVAEAVAYLCRLPRNITVDVIHLRRAGSAQTWG